MASASIASGRGHTSSVYALSLSDRLLASGGEDGSLCFWSLDQSPFPVHFTRRSDPCSAVKFIPSNQNSVFSAHGQTIYLWDLRQLRCPVFECKVNEDEVNSIDILETEACLAAADDSGAVKVISTTSGSVVRTLKKHDNICSAAVFRPYRSWQLISGGLDCRLIVTDWKGSGLGVIIFELAEIVSNGVVESLSPNAYSQIQDPSSGDSDSYASTSEYAELQQDAIDESEGEGSTEEVLLPAASAVHEDNTEGGGNWGPQFQTPTEVDEQMDSGSDVSSQSDGDSHGSAVARVTSVSAADAWSFGLPVNPPMVHSVACSASGDLVAAGLEKSTIELFAGDGKRLTHKTSLYGHRRGVSALHFIGDTFLISGGTDLNLILWTLSTETEKRPLVLDAKVNAIEGRHLQKIFIADCSPVVRLMDLSVS